VFCILDAPDKDAVDKSHQKIGIKSVNALWKLKKQQLVMLNKLGCNIQK
jgi:hypothetical protein